MSRFFGIPAAFLLAGLLVAAPARARWVEPSQAAFWASIFPGGGYFYLEDYGKGAFLAASELSLVGGGIYMDFTRDDCSLSDYNPLYLLALKEHEFGMFLSYREARRAIDNYGYETPLDQSSVGRLLAAPFLPENLKDPYVHLFWLSGLAIVLAEFFADPPPNGNDYGDLDRIRMWDFELGRERGTYAYEGAALGVSLAAAVGEEAAWRGTIQAEYERLFGREGGLLFTSFIFGLAHLYGPGTWRGRWEAAAVGTAGGLYLGWLFDYRGYRLGPPAAAHFWFNFITATSAFFLDPARNPLGFSVGFNF